MSHTPTEFATPFHGSYGLASVPAEQIPDYDPESAVGDLFRDPGGYDFFQAVSLIQRFQQRHHRVGRAALPAHEPIRFRAALGTAFPVSAITEALPPTPDFPQVELTVALFGLTGPSGILPRHYTQLIADLHRTAKSSEKNALRDWFDLFNSRLLALYYRAWDKYRIDQAIVRDEHSLRDPDPFTTSMFSLCGLGVPQLRDRLHVTAPVEDRYSQKEETLAEVNDLGLLRYVGLLSQRPRTPSNLKQLLRDYFTLPVEIEQFHGQWLGLDESQQTALSATGGNNVLGESALAGERVWDFQSKIRIRLGPLTGEQFNELLPDDDHSLDRKSFFVLCHLTRLFIGQEFDFDVQLELRGSDAPNCTLSYDNQAPRLGWTTWLPGEETADVVNDAVFGCDCGLGLGSETL